MEENDEGTDEVDKMKDIFDKKCHSHNLVSHKPIRSVVKHYKGV